MEVHPPCHEEHRLLSNSATLADNKIDLALPKKATFTVQNANPSQLEELIQNLNLLKGPYDRYGCARPRRHFAAHPASPRGKNSMLRKLHLAVGFHSCA